MNHIWRIVVAAPNRRTGWKFLAEFRYLKDARSFLKRYPKAKIIKDEVF